MSDTDLSSRIRQRREQLGLSQEELAARMGYRSKSSITKLEKGINDLPRAKLEELAAALGALCSYASALVVPLAVLIAVMLADYASGMAKAWSAGKLCSKTGLRGILKKLGYLVLVGVAGVVDWLVRYGLTQVGVEVSFQFLMAAMVIVWLIINELISILENVAALGGPVPGFLRKLLTRLKATVETKAGEEDKNADQ